MCGVVCVCLQDEDEFIGFATLPDQVHRKAVRRGFDFTLMVVGQYPTPPPTLSPLALSSLPLFFTLFPYLPLPLFLCSFPPDWVFEASPLSGSLLGVNNNNEDLSAPPL